MDGFFVMGNNSNREGSMTFPRNKLADSGGPNRNLSFGKKPGMFGDFI